MSALQEFGLESDKPKLIARGLSSTSYALFMMTFFPLRVLSAKLYFWTWVLMPFFELGTIVLRNIILYALAYKNHIKLQKDSIASELYNAIDKKDGARGSAKSVIMKFGSNFNPLTLSIRFILLLGWFVFFRFFWLIDIAKAFFKTYVTAIEVAGRCVSKVAYGLTVLPVKKLKSEGVVAAIETIALIGLGPLLFALKIVFSVMGNAGIEYRLEQRAYYGSFVGHILSTILLPFYLHLLLKSDEDKKKAILASNDNGVIGDLFVAMAIIPPISEKYLLVPHAIVLLFHGFSYGFDLAVNQGKAPHSIHMIPMLNEKIERMSFVEHKIFSAKMRAVGNAGDYRVANGDKQLNDAYEVASAAALQAYFRKNNCKDAFLEVNGTQKARANGYEGFSGDGGFDASGHIDAHTGVVVSCKRYSKSNMTVNEIREIHSLAMYGEESAWSIDKNVTKIVPVAITTKGYTADAKRIASKAGVMLFIFNNGMIRRVG